MSESKISEGFGLRLGEFLGVDFNSEPKFMMVRFVNEDISKYLM